MLNTYTKGFLHDFLLLYDIVLKNIITIDSIKDELIKRKKRVIGRVYTEEEKATKQPKQQTIPKPKQPKKKSPFPEPKKLEMESACCNANIYFDNLCPIIDKDLVEKGYRAVLFCDNCMKEWLI